jgi:hypothetical protein
MIGLGTTLGSRRVNRPTRLQREFEGLFGASSILSLRMGCDWKPDSNGKIASLTDRYSDTGGALGGELATLSTFQGYPCAIWQVGSVSCYYSDVAGSLCNIAVCQYEGPLPFTGYPVVLWDTGLNPIHGGSGGNTWGGGATFRVDNVLTRVADTVSPHVLIADAATSPGTAGCSVSAGGVGTSKFVGKMFLTARLAVRPTASQYNEMHVALKRAFAFLP